jgi:hypothetical protein
MDRESIEEALGETGRIGVWLIAIGFAVLFRENRRAAVAAVAVVVGIGLVGHGLVGSVLESMGLDYEDVY